MPERLRPVPRPEKAPEPRKHRTGTLPHDLDHTEAEARTIINARVRDYLRAGGTLKALAKKADVSVPTVSRLAYFETSHPVGSTIFKVCRALGIRIRFE